MRFGAITLDTNIFHRNGLRIDQGLLRALDQFNGKPARLLLSEIVVRELVVHLEKKANDAKLLLERALKEAEDHLEFNCFDFYEVSSILTQRTSCEDIAKSKVGEFIRRTDALVIKVDGLLDVQELIKKYFSGGAPFSKIGKKKSEFPDAMILMSLEAYAKEKNIKVLAVSADEDWASYAKDSEWLVVVEELAQGISEFQSENRAFDFCRLLSEGFEVEDSGLLFQLNSHIKNAIAELDYDIDASSIFTWETIQIDTEYQGFEFVGGATGAVFYPIQDHGDTMSVETKVRMRIIARGEFLLTVADSSDRDGESVQVGVSSKSVNFEIDASLLMVVTKDLSCEIFGADLSKVEISYRPPVINFGDLEPAWSEE